MSLKKSIMATAAMMALAAQSGPGLYQDSGFAEGYSHIGKSTAKTPLTPKQKKARKNNKSASRSRAKNRRK